MARFYVYDGSKYVLAGEGHTDSDLSSTSTNPIQNKAVYAALGNKVDKVSGKGLSTNDYTTAEKEQVAANTAARHSHSNKSVLDDITADDVAKWRGTKGVFRINVTYSGGIYSADKTFTEIKAAYDAGQQLFVVDDTEFNSGTIYTLDDFLYNESSADGFADFKRHFIWDGAVVTDKLRICSYTTDNGSNVVHSSDRLEIPTSLKNPNALTIKVGSTTVTYDGSAAKTVEIADGSEVSY